MSGTDNSKLVSIFEGITTKLVESKEPNRLYDVAVQIAMETTDAQACSLYLEQSVMDTVKEPDHIIMMVAGAGFEKFRIGVKYRKGQGLTGGIWETSKSVKFDTQEQIEDRKKGWKGLYNDVVREKVKDWVSYSLIGVPLRIGERTIGVLKVENKNPGKPCSFSEEDRVMLEIIASTIALAIENQRYSEQSYSSILNALRDVSKMLVGPETLTFKILCDSIVEKCIAVFNAEACSLYIEEIRDSSMEPEHIVMVSGAGYENTRTGAKYQKGDGLTGSIWKNSLPVKYDTRQEVEDSKHGWKGLYNQQVREKVVNWECCSLIGVPLRIGDRTIGVLKVENKKPVKHSHFTYYELRSLEILASNIALALEMHRNREVLFKRGFDARKFTHSIVGHLQTSLSGVRDARSLIQSRNKFIPLPEVIQFLETVENTLLTMDDIRKLVLSDKSADQYKFTISVNHLLHRVIDHCQPVLSRRNVELSVKFLENEVFTNVNPEEVLEAFDNLIGNAIDAVDNNVSPKIWIEATYSKDPSKVIDVATVLLVDNGPGFTVGQRKEFESTKSIHSSKHGGLGLGMVITSGCFHDNGIYLKIIDPPSRMTQTGAAFQINIPLCEPRNLRVLIIDDDENLLKILKLKGSLSGKVFVDTRTTYEILLEAINGSEVAINTLSSFDLILLDCFFPAAPLDGPDLFKRLQDTNRELASRIVLMSVKDEYQTRTDVAVFDKTKDIHARFPEGLHDLRKRKA